MDCQTCREAVSARIDGEPEPVQAEQTDQHLQGCAECRLWQARAIEVSRLVRVREVTPTPDLTDRILRETPVPADASGSWSRFALALVAIIQLALGVTQVFGMEPSGLAGHESGGLSGHLFNESTAWNIAIGIGLFWVVWRPRAAAGLIPVLGGFVLVLLVFSTYDLITGAVPLSRIAGHGVLIVGLLLLVVMGRRHRDPAPGRGDAVPVPGATDEDNRSDCARPDGDEPGPEPHPLRSVGHYRVA